MLHSQITRTWIDNLVAESGNIRLSGWIAHPSLPITGVRIALDGQHFGELGPLEDRPDVLEHLGEDACTSRCGFVMSAPFAAAAEDPTAIRVKITPIVDGGTLTPIETRYYAQHEDDDQTPPTHLQERIGGSVDFRKLGHNIATYLRTYIGKYGNKDLQDCKVLDWGCGCGRVVWELRRFVPPGQIFGCDIDPEAIQWGQSNIPDVRLQRIDPLPPTPYPDDFFDVIYAISVMTHLDEETQFRWLREIQRIARPGSLLIFSVSGELMEAHMPPQLVEAFKAKGFAAYVPEYSHILAEFSSPDYYKESFHQFEYIEREWAAYFTLLEYVETRYQDLVVMRAE